MQLKHPTENPEFWEGHSMGCGLSFGPGDATGHGSVSESSVLRSACEPACFLQHCPCPTALAGATLRSLLPSVRKRGPRWDYPAFTGEESEAWHPAIGLLSPSLNLPPGATLARHSPLGAFMNSRLPRCCLVKICRNVGNGEVMRETCTGRQKPTGYEWALTCLWGDLLGSRASP